REEGGQGGSATREVVRLGAVETGRRAVVAPPDSLVVMGQDEAARGLAGARVARGDHASGVDRVDALQGRQQRLLRQRRAGCLESLDEQGGLQPAEGRE